MSDIKTVHSLESEGHSSVTQELRAVEQEVDAFVQRINAKEIKIAVTPQEQTLRAVQQQMTAALPQMQQSIQGVQQQIAQSPVVVPVKFDLPESEKQVIIGALTGKSMGLTQQEASSLLKKVAPAFPGMTSADELIPEILKHYAGAPLPSVAPAAAKLVDNVVETATKVANQQIESTARAKSAVPETTLEDRSRTAQANAYRSLYYNTVRSQALDTGSDEASELAKAEKAAKDALSIKGSSTNLSWRNIGSIVGTQMLAGRLLSFGQQGLEENIRDISDFNRLGNNVNSGNLLETARQTRDRAVEENSGLIGWFREHSSIYQNGFSVSNLLPFGVGSQFDLKGRGSPSDDLSALNQSVVDAERGERRSNTMAQFGDNRKQLDEQILRATDGPAAVRLKQLEEWKTSEERLATQLDEDGKKNQASMIRSRAATVAAIQEASINAEKSAHERDNAFDVANAQDQSALAIQSAGGDNVGAAFESQRKAVRRNVERLGLNYQRLRNDPMASQTDRDAAEQQYNAAGATQESQITEINRKEANQRADIEKQSQDAIRQIREQSQQQQLASQGRFHEASVQSQKLALDNQISDLEYAYAHAEGDAAKHAAKMALEAAKAQAPVTAAAIDAAETRRQSIEAAAYDLDSRQGGLSDQPLNFAGNRQLIKDRLDGAINRMESGPAKDAAIRRRDSQLAAFDRNAARSLRGINETGRQAALEATGNSATAEVEGFREDLRDQLTSAGGDLNTRRAILTRAEARAQLLARRQVRGGTFGSTDDYLQSIQQGSFSGTGSAMVGLQQLFKGIKGAEGAGSADAQDRLLNQAGDKFTKATDKLLSAGNKVLILRVKQ